MPSEAEWAWSRTSGMVMLFLRSDLMPRAVLGGEDITGVFRRELLPGVERDAERSGMGLEQNVGHGDAVLEIGPRAAVPRIFVGADIVPGPAVKRAFSDPGDVVAGDI